MYYNLRLTRFIRRVARGALSTGGGGGVLTGRAWQGVYGGLVQAQPRVKTWDHAPGAPPHPAAATARAWPREPALLHSRAAPCLARAGPGTAGPVP